MLRVSYTALITFRAMTTEAAPRLQQKVQQAEIQLTALRQQVDLLRKDAVVKACAVEENRLRAENEQLRQEVEKIRNELIQQEIFNGVKQVYIKKPSASAAVAVNPADTDKKPAATDKKPAVTDNKTSPDTILVNKPAQQTEKKKQAKEKKTEQKDQKSSKTTAPETLDVSSLDMRIGLIVNAKKHPDADSLYVEEVDVGEASHRTIVSGLVKHVPLEQMQNRFAIFLLNLKPATMRGVSSQGMIMCASSPEKVEIISPPPGVVQGEKVQVVGYTGTPLEQLNPKKKHFEQIQPDLRINETGHATYKGALWEVPGKGNCKAPTMTNSAIR